MAHDVAARLATAPAFSATTPADGADKGTTGNGIEFVSHPVVQKIEKSSDSETADPAMADPDKATSLGQLVGEMTTGAKLSPQLNCLAKAVYFESRGENLDGQLAVAEVVINRAESTQFPDNYCAVVTQPAQFSFVRDGRMPTPRTNSRAWRRARAIARIAHRDLWQSAAADALYFHAKRVNPRWAHRMALAATIDRHIFYK